MALRATIFKAEITISDLVRNYYADHSLTIARHPSENDERMMARILAFAMNAGERLLFSQGMNDDDEPDISQKDLTGAIELWIEVGQPEEKRIRKASGRAKRTLIYTYSGHSADVWWEQIRAGQAGADNLAVIKFQPKQIQALTEMVQRTMKLQFTIQETQVWVSDGQVTHQVDITVVKNALKQ